MHRRSPSKRALQGSFAQAGYRYRSDGQVIKPLARHQRHPMHVAMSSR